MSADFHQTHRFSGKLGSRPNQVLYSASPSYLKEQISLKGCIYTCIYMCIYISIYIYYVYVYTYARTYVCMHACMYVYVKICIVHMYCVCTYIYILSHTHRICVYKIHVIYIYARMHVCTSM